MHGLFAQVMKVLQFETNLGELHQRSSGKLGVLRHLAIFFAVDFYSSKVNRSDSSVMNSSDRVF